MQTAGHTYRLHFVLGLPCSILLLFQKLPSLVVPCLEATEEVDEELDGEGKRSVQLPIARSPSEARPARSPHPPPPQSLSLPVTDGWYSPRREF